MNIIQGTNQNFDELVSRGVVLVKFFATWCGPCRMLNPIIEEVSNEKNLTVVTVDIDKETDLTIKYSVMSVPTLMLFKDGKLIKKQFGFLPKESLLKWIEEI